MSGALDEAALPTAPSAARQVTSALAVLALLGALWSLIEWRSAPPPPRALEPAAAVRR